MQGWIASHACKTVTWLSFFLQITTRTHYSFFSVWMCAWDRSFIQKPATWKEENHITISSVNTSSIRDFSSSSTKNRHTGHVFLHTLNHLSIHTSWNSCKQARVRMSFPSFNPDKHTQHRSPSTPSFNLDIEPLGSSSNKPTVFCRSGIIDNGLLILRRLRRRGKLQKRKKSLDNHRNFSSGTNMFKKFDEGISINIIWFCLVLKGGWLLANGVEILRP